MDDPAALFDDARARLVGVPRVRLGAVREARGILRLFGGGPAIAPVAEAWHLGVLLVGDDAVWATGDVLRAAAEVRRGFTAEAQRIRAARAAMAFRGGFAEGETCHVGWDPVDVAAAASGPLVRQGDRAMVRWSPAGFLAPLDEYLEERIRLARDGAG
ncbi:glutaminase [Microbacterium karelineae]|uniref:glutaminase n=1 Tax=Microbacterium karelineae TaxID=2654283 RepID=UPI0012E9AFA7|nr:glutaminase [Microbacterium karelineae]